MQDQPIPSPRKRNLRGHALPPVIHPDPILAAEGISITFIERFFSKVRKTETCWIWEGAIKAVGSQVILRGKRRGGNIQARKAAWLIYNGEIPPGAETLRACPFGNPDCVHPNHIHLGSHGDIAEVRYAQKAHRELLSEQLQRFEKLCEQADTSLKELHAKYNVSRPTPEWMIQQGFSPTLAERFYRKFKIVGECWIWTAGKNTDGYGQIGIRGAQNCGAHCVSYMLHKGPIPPGKEVCHDCPGRDNPACVNPDHLWPGSSKENSNDALTKGSFIRKLTFDDVREIRRLYSLGGITMPELAKRFGVSRNAIGRTVYREHHRGGRFFITRITGALPEGTRTGNTIINPTNK